MHPFLTRLGVPVKVQEHFAPYFAVDRTSNLSFSFDDADEIFGPGLHKVPATEGLWVAGDMADPAIRHIYICHSAMEALAFLSLYGHRMAGFDNCLFIATGSGLNPSQLSRIREGCECKTCAFIFGNGLFGHIADLKAASGIRKIPLSISLMNDGYLTVKCRSKHFLIAENEFSLHAFERHSGLRFRCLTYKAKSASSYLDLLRTHRRI